MAARVLDRARTATPNLPCPTFGGMQVWRDVYLHAGWRIQERHGSGACRLLGPSDWKRVSGSYDACRDRFETLRAHRDIAPRSAPRPFSLRPDAWIRPDRRAEPAGGR